MVYFSKYNTDTLAYKLLSGNLKRNRKHSEQLNKYLAGMIDTDGCISLFFYKTRTTGKNKVSVTVNLTQSASNDQDFEFMRAIKDFYDLGSLSFNVAECETESSTCSWILRDKESKILFNRIGKHLRLKGTHFDNMVWVSEQHKEVEDIPEPIIEELKEFSICSRENTRFLKHPKHLSWAYVAGVVAGDGSIKYLKRSGNNFPEMKIKITQKENYKGFLELFKRDFKGNIYHINSWVDWERNLGIRDASFAVKFLKKIRSYIIHERKYQIINEILDFHESRRQQRLNRENPKG